MAQAEASAAIVALVIAVVALFVSTSQLLAQIFATAEGTRRCSESAIGNWGKLTTRKWHWSEWRFETVFASPHIQLGLPVVSEKPLRHGSASDLLSLHEHMGPSHVQPINARLLVAFLEPSTVDSGNQFDGWIRFLSELKAAVVKHHVISSIPKDSPKDSSHYWDHTPGVRIRLRSWDSMPLDVIRPIASISLFDLAVLANRMGMSWRTFKPEQGQLLAEGRSQVLSSVEIRGLGLAMSYKKLSSDPKQEQRRQLSNMAGNRRHNVQDQDQKDRSIWSDESAMIAFGMFPGNPDFDLPNFAASTKADSLHIFNDVFNLSGQADWNHIFTHAWCARYEINELLPLVSPILREKHTGNIYYIGSHYWPSLFTFKIARVVHGVLIDRRLKTKPSEHLSWIRQCLSEMDEPLKSAHLSHTWYDETTMYFQNIEKRYGGFYWHLLRAHFSKSPVTCAESRKKCMGKNTQRPRDEVPGEGNGWRSEQVNMLWDFIPCFVKFMEDQGFDDELLVEEAWITLFFRGICWSNCNRQSEGTVNDDFLPMKYYGSQVPVYLV